MKQHPGYRLALKTLLRDERGAILIILAVYLPVVLGFFALAVDMSYVLSTRNMLQVTAEAAALAATSTLPNNSACTVPASACYIAEQYAGKNMPAASYGKVLADADVSVGKWDYPTTSFTPGGLPYNAVKVTTRMAAANGNALKLFFAQALGWRSIDVPATAIAVYGTQPGATWDISIVQDISGSFTYNPDYYYYCYFWYYYYYSVPSFCGSGGPQYQGALPQAKAADQALLDCVNGSAPAGSRVGITPFTGTAWNNYQAPVAVNTNYSALKTAINNIPQCALDYAGAPAAQPLCSKGTDIAAGINSTIAQYNNLSPGPSGSLRNMVVVTDGLPETVNGTPCYGNSSCIAQAQQNALNAADAAGCGGNCASPDPSKVINVSTIYYCSDINCSSSADVTAAAWLATLKQGTGIALKTPDPTKISTLMQQVCATQPHRLVW
jgi:Flp pilus assembly protein TadG